MAALTRSVVATGSALATVAALCAAAPAAVPALPPMHPVVSQPFQLTAKADISGQGLGVVFLVGWGGFIGPDDPYFPGQFNNDVKLSGPLGVAYYVVDNSMDGTTSRNLENYIFEVGANDPLAGLQAAAYVSVASNLGVTSVPAKLAKSLIYGVPFDVNGAIVQLTDPIPLVGDLTSVYFTGQAPNDPAIYGTGLNGLVAYSGTLMPWLKPLLGPAGQPRIPAAAEAPAADAVTADVPAAPDAPLAPLTPDVPVAPDAPAAPALAEVTPVAALKSAAERAPEPAAEPMAEVAAEPAAASAPEPAAEPATEPAIESAPEPVVQAPKASAATEPVAEPDSAAAPVLRSAPGGQAAHTEDAARESDTGQPAHRTRRGR